MLIIEILFISYFTYVTTYNLIFGIAGLFYRSPKVDPKTDLLRFAVFIPAYKEDGVIVKVAEEALKQNYPIEKYSVVVIADSLKKKTLELLQLLPIEVVEVSFKKSTKVKALNKALSRFDKTFDNAVIIDADNVMAPDFLKQLNHLHASGLKAIQGRRSGKNKQNSMALLDGLSEEINNHFFCKGSTALNLSSSLKGSGMSFNYTLLKQELSQMESIGGFDRELEVRLVEKGIKVKYAHKIVVYDEKVANRQVFENQRKRWISSQFIYLKKYFLTGCNKLLTTGDLAFFNSSVLRNIQLPRLINLGLVLLFTLAAVVFKTYLEINYLYWVLLLVVLYTSTVIAIPREYLNGKLFLAILKLPLIFLSMLKALVGIKGANKKFIHTPHSS